MTAPRTAVAGSCRYPISPKPAEDSRFTFGLLTDVVDALRAWGYPAPAAVDFVELQQVLFRFLHGDTCGNRHVSGPGSWVCDLWVAHAGLHRERTPAGEVVHTWSDMAGTGPAVTE